MGRLIDADMLIQKINPDRSPIDPIEARAIVVQSPTIGTVQVCKECRFSEPHGDFWYCYKIHAYTPQDFGCNQGKPRCIVVREPNA